LTVDENSFVDHAKKNGVVQNSDGRWYDQATGNVLASPKTGDDMVLGLYIGLAALAILALTLLLAKRRRRETKNGGAK
jgi:LPXTG-motif cell wall-anchored protein